MLWDRGYRVELLSFFEPRFRWFSKWWEQLFAESEGKDGRGIFPAAAECSEELHSLGQFVQDGTHILFETFLDILEPGAGDSLVLGGTDVADAFGYLDGKDFWDINKASFTATCEAQPECCHALRSSSIVLTRSIWACSSTGSRSRAMLLGSFWV